MATNEATNYATQKKVELDFVLDFDKKKLTKNVLRCEQEHQRLKQWLSNTIICSHFKTKWENVACESIYSLTWGDSNDPMGARIKGISEALQRQPYFKEMTLMETMHKGLRKNNVPSRVLQLAGISPVPYSEIIDRLDVLMAWKAKLPSQSVSTLYQTLLMVYYLTLLQPMGAVQTALNCVLLSQCLQKMGFGIVGDYILKFYAEHENIVAETLSMSYCARDKTYHQQPWFQLFFEGWAWALKKLEQDIHIFCMESCFNAHATALLENKTMNERQYQLIKQLQHEQTIRDKKSLSFSLWYRVLYKGLTKRTQERDFQLMVELGLIVMVGKNRFELGGG